MSNPQAIESLVRDLHELANEADGKKDVSGGAYGLSNLSASGGLLTGGAKRRRRRKRRGAGASGGYGTRAGGLKNQHAKKTGAYMRKHNVKLGVASKAVAQGKS